MSKDVWSVGLSLIAVALSATTAWLTLVRRGRLRMTRPTVVFFGPDGGSGRDGAPRPKVFLRTLLYSTAQRGHIVESMYVSLRRSESKQTFNIWVYGDSQRLARGSGLYVGQSGVVCNHHFLLPDDGSAFAFLMGEYNVQVFASVVGSKGPSLLSEFNLVVTDGMATALKNPRNGLYFDWGPDSAAYHAHMDERPEKDPLPSLLGLSADIARLATERVTEGIVRP